MTKQVADKNGNVINGLFRNADNSLSLNNITEYQKSKLQHDNFASLSDEINLLKMQIKIILEKLNG